MTEAFILDRMVRAVEKVRERLRRAAAALEAAVRNTQDVDILLRRGDLPAATAALESAGFVFRQAAGVTMFLDGAGGKDRDAVHVIFAGEKVRAEHDHPAPDVAESEPSPDGAFRHLTFDTIVRMKLTSFRDKDRMHLRDMAEVGLVDGDWPGRLPPPLGERLRQLLADPDG